MKKWKDNISFVLVEPRDPGNIGSSARALKNMGFGRLSLVNPVPLTDETRWLAHNALDVIKAAAVYSDLAEALKKKAIIIGTTRRKGKRRGLIYNVDDGAKKIVELASTNKVAILFGREDRGLYNEEVEECGFMLNIPANAEHRHRLLRRGRQEAVAQIARHVRLQARLLQLAGALQGPRHPQLRPGRRGLDRGV